MDGFVTEAKLAYLAGVFDGEGCVAAYTSKASTGIYYPRLSVSMTDLVALKMFQEAFGGTIKTRDSHAKRNPKHKIQYEWIVRVQDAADAAKALAKYCKVKRTQLELLQTLTRPKQKGVRLDPETRTHSYRVALELKRLKGVPVHD